MAYAFGICCSSALFSCGTDEENRRNPTQQETRPALGAQPDAKMTNPNTPGRQAQEGEINDRNVELGMTDPQIGDAEMVPSRKLMENIASNSQLSTLAGALKKADLVNTLNATGPYTIFAPQNEAFEALPNGTLEDLMKTQNKQRLIELLNNHVVAGRLTAADLKDGTTLKTVGGEQLNITKRGNQVMVNGAQVVMADAVSSNGVIHVINKVVAAE